MSMEEVVSALEQVQTGKNVMEATDFLKSLTTQRGFTSAVLELLISEGLSPEVQQGAALLLKNAVVSNWVAVRCFLFLVSRVGCGPYMTCISYLSGLLRYLQDL